MSHSPPLPARLVSLLVTTLAVACGSPTETTPPPPLAEATLAFTMDSSIYLISSDTGATPSLLLSGFIRPSWSPDGGTLAMVATGPPRIPGFPPEQALYLADADGGNVRGLTNFDWLIGGQALWSPDGTALLFLRNRSFPGANSVVRVEAAGGLETGLVGVGNRFPGEPSWSHDGSLIALDDGLVVIDAVTGNTVLHVAGFSPRFSPVNDDLAFREPTTGHIHLIRPDSSDRDLQADGYPLSWSPDGKRIAFDGNGGIYMMNPDGSHLSRIGPADVEVTDLAWSADGRRMAYVVRTSSGPASVYLARADDSDRRAVVTAEGVCCLSWRP
jgi:Tol biopolymer transport system component